MIVSIVILIMIVWIPTFVLIDHVIAGVLETVVSRSDVVAVAVLPVAETSEAVLPIIRCVGRVLIIDASKLATDGSSSHDSTIIGSHCHSWYCGW